jgi:hypothetical protein
MMLIAGTKAAQTERRPDCGSYLSALRPTEQESTAEAFIRSEVLLSHKAAGTLG